MKTRILISILDGRPYRIKKNIYMCNSLVELASTRFPRNDCSFLKITLGEEIKHILSGCKVESNNIDTRALGFRHCFLFTKIPNSRSTVLHCS